MSHFRQHASRRYKGVRPHNASDHNPLSPKLRSVRDLIKHRQFATALSQLDTLAAQFPDATSQSRIVSMAGDVEFAQGRYGSAAQNYQRAKLMLPTTEQTEWLRASIGEVQSLLKDTNVLQATTRARATFSEGSARQLSYTNSSPQSPTINSLIVLERPQRPSVVATRLGYLFLAEGELDAAQEFFDGAVQANPAGACKARIGLGLVAEKRGDYTTAALQAKQAILIGAYRAKTISAWPLLVRAQLRSTGSFDDTLLVGLAQATPTVRARATWSVVKALWGRNNSQWLTVANQWLKNEGISRNSIIAVEIEKLKLVDNVRRGVNPEFEARALFREPILGPREWLFGVKRLVAVQAEVLVLPSLVNAGVASFGENWRTSFVHGIFKACLEAKRPDLSKPLLESVVALPPTTQGWNRALFALARLHKFESNYAAAADLYLRCAGEQLVPLSYRIAARVKRANCLVELDDQASLLSEKAELLALLQSDPGFDNALDLAQQLTNAPAELNAMAQEVFSIGKTRALAELNTATNPAYAATILFKLARRAADFGNQLDTITRWEALSPQKRLWLWSQGEIFWQYLGFVFQAYRDSGATQTAKDFANTYLSDPATPPVGMIILGILRGLTSLAENNFSAAFTDFENFTLINPAHEAAAYGFYWLSLRASKMGNASSGQTFADKLDLALGNKIGMKWKAELKRAVICIRANMLEANLPLDGIYSYDQLVATLQTMRNDFAKI